MKTLLFIDDWLLDRREHMERVLHQPEIVAESVLAEPGKTEGAAYLTAIFDEQREVYRLWFNDFTSPETGLQSLVIRYAESEDGYHWKVRDIDDNGDRWADLAPGVVFSGEHMLNEAMVWYDPEEVDPERRFKMPHIVAERYDPKPIAECRWAFSADGNQWQVVRDYPWLDAISDTANSPIRNPYTGRVQMTVRKEWGDRRVALIESADLETWTQPRTILHPDPQDPECAHFYGMPQFFYEGYFLGFLWLMHTVPDEMSVNKNSGAVDCQLTYSYDGLSWNRGPREPFVPNRPAGEYGCGCVYPSSMLVGQDGSLRIYAGGSRWGHEWTSDGENSAAGNAVLSYRLRRDGFVGLEAKCGCGHLVTKLVRLKDEALSINVCAPSGVVRVQISDEEGKPFPGFGFSDCIPFTGDDTEWQPRWREHEDLAGLLGADPGVRIEVLAERAELFAMRLDCGLRLPTGAIQDRL